MDDLDDELIVPPPDWLFGLAKEVRELVREPLSMERFREMVQIWARDVEHWYVASSWGGMEGVPVEPLPYDYGIDLIPLPDRELKLTEKYAVLSAIHDNCCKGEKINPWRAAVVPPPRDAMRYTVLCCSFRARTRSGFIESGRWIVSERDEYLLREFIADVGPDLERYKLTESAPPDVGKVISSPAVWLPGLPESARELDELMTLNQIASLVSFATGSTVAGKTLQNKRLLGKAAVLGGGRGNASKWHYATVKPKIEAEYGRELPELAEALRHLSNPQ